MNRPVVYGEYPYYRAAPDRWAANVASLAEAGIDVVTCYVPWRFHELSPGRYDFAGATMPQRDLRRLLRLIADSGLRAVLKPGPFVHGEVQFGGLPDRVSPDNEPSYSAVSGASGELVTAQGLALPSLFCPHYRAEVRDWLTAVDAQVLSPTLAPDGPVVAVQIGNEGIYSDAHQPVSAHDFSPPAIRAFAEHLGGGTLGLPADWSADIRARWAQWSGEALRDHYRWLAACLSPASRKLATVNLPLPALDGPAGAAESWLLRTAHLGETGCAEGYTSWVGNAARSVTAFGSHWFGVRARRSANVEDNWGFTWTDPSYARPATPLFHALLALGLGSSSCSVYTACATEHWGPEIDLDPDGLRRDGLDPRDYAPPYCPGAPLREDGTAGANLMALHALRDLVRGHGEALRGGRFAADVSLLVPTSAVRSAAWPGPGDPAAHPALRGAVELAVDLMLNRQYRVDVVTEVTAATDAHRSSLVVTGASELGGLPAPRYADPDSDPAVVLVHENDAGIATALFAFNPGERRVTARRLVRGTRVVAELPPGGAACLLWDGAGFSPVLATDAFDLTEPMRR